MTTKIFYVYALCYADGAPFYIGKGNKNRVNNHLKKAARNGTDPISAAINSIRANGSDVLIKYLFETDDEGLAIIRERQIIKTESKNHSLLNIQFSDTEAKKRKNRDTVDFRINIPKSLSKTIAYHQAMMNLKSEDEIFREAAIIDLLNRGIQTVPYLVDSLKDK